MSRSLRGGRPTLAAWILTLLLAWAGGLARAQDGNDAGPFISTPPDVVTAMLELAGVGSRDVVVDLGSGDGRILIEAVRRFGARGLGLERNPDLVRMANQNANRAGVLSWARTFPGDLFTASINQGTVVTLYLLPQALARLAPKLYEDYPAGTRIVSHDYAIPAFTPEKRLELTVPEKEQITGTSRTVIYLYLVAAPVRGRWTLLLPQSLGNRATLQLEQEYDRVSGTVEYGGQRTPVTGARISGRQLRFQVPFLGERSDVFFRLEVREGRMEGTATAEGSTFQIGALRETRR